MADIRPICGQGIGSFSYFGLHCELVPSTHKNAGTDGHGGPSYLDSFERFQIGFFGATLKSCGVGTGAHCRKLYDWFEGADWDQRYGSKLSPAKINGFIASNDQNWWVQNGMVIAPKWLDCQKVGDFPLHVPRLPLQIRAFSLDRLAAARHGSRVWPSKLQFLGGSGPLRSWQLWAARSRVSQFNHIKCGAGRSTIIASPTPKKIEQ